MPGTSQSAARKIQIRLLKLLKAAGDFVLTNEGWFIGKKTSGAATQVTLPTNPEPGDIVFVSDAKGDAGTNPITVVPDGIDATTISGLTSYLINRAYGGVIFGFTGTEWIATAAVNGPGGLIQSATGVAVHDSAAEAVSASYNIPANTIKQGTVVRVRGRFTATATVGTDTLQFKLRLGSSTLTGTALITGTATDVANGDVGLFEFNLYGTTAPGAAVAILGDGRYVEPAGTTWKVALLASTNFATNAGLRLEATLKWSTANANSALVDWMTVEIFG